MRTNTIKIFVMLAVAVILGTLISVRDFSLSFYLYNNYGLNEVRPIFLNTLAHALYSVVLIFTLLWINLEWKGMGSRKEAIRFIVSLLATLVLFYLADSIINTDLAEQVYHKFMNRPHHGEHGGINFLAVKSFYIFFIVYTGGLIYKLYVKKTEAEKSLEKLKSESLQSRLTALSNQINPHFFFNSLNSLHALVMENRKEDSLAYISNLSGVFRYIMRSDSKNMVTLKEELAFLGEYMSMLEVRYGDRLRFEIRIPDEYLSYWLPVLALLPLVENVIKHNEISQSHPMTVEIYTDEECLCIVNKIRSKIDPPAPGGIGLENLNRRYKILMDKEIITRKSADVYSVCLPLKGDNE